VNAILPQIFPPGLPLLHGPELTAPLATWAAQRIRHVSDFGPCWSVGVVRRAELADVVIFHDFQPAHGTAQVSVAADSPLWASRQVIRAILGAAFSGRLGAPVRKVWSAMQSGNERAIRFNIGIGFTREAVLRHHFAHGVHAVITSMMQREYARRYGE
jgi:RimJ/RimL family protein N-acetyltransferase